MPDRHARAQRLRDFFELNLRFAAAFAERSGVALRDALLKVTPLHRRFGFGDPDRGVTPQWHDYVRRLDEMPVLADRVAWTQTLFAEAPEETLPPGQRFFGCFGFETPDADGVVRIHFVDRDRDGTSPLHRDKIVRRQRDIANLIGCVVETCPTARSIRGMSWLYHLDAYRRLFPPPYGSSRMPAPRVRLSGLSSWGQFIHHDGTIRPQPRDAFVTNFAAIDPAAPWCSFPLRALTVTAPLSVFRDFYRDSRRSD